MFYKPTYPDTSDYQTNAPTYGDDLARKTELIKYLSHRIWEYDKELAARFLAWDKNLEEFDEEVLRLLKEWMDDGTFEHIINEVLMSQKLDASVFNSYVTVVKITNPADITADVQKAVDSLPGKGGTVYIPYGDWIMHGYVELKDNMTIKASKGTVLRKNLSSTSAYSFLAGKSFGKPGYGGGGKNITIDGLTFAGFPQDTAIYYANGLAFHHTQNLHIVNCIFKDSIFAGHCIDLAGCQQVVIEHCDFIGQVRIPGKEYAEAIQIDTSATNAIGSDWGGLDGLPTKDVLVQHCNFLPSFNGNGLMVSYAPNPIGNHGYTGGAYYENIQFNHNTVVDAADTTTNWRGWIHFYGLKNAKFLHNTFKNTRGIFANVISLINSTGGRYDPGTLIAGTGIPMPCQDIDIIGNHFEGFNARESQSLIKSYGTSYEGVSYPVSGYTISDNIFDRCGVESRTIDTGPTLIQIYRCQDITIEGNNAYLGNALASVWDGSHVSINNNTARRLAGATVFLSNVQNAVVANNRTRESRRQLEIQEVNVLTVTGNTSYDTIQENATNFANKFRNLNNANVSGNVAHSSDNTMSYGYYFYQTNETLSKNVNNHDNIADGFTVRPSNKSGNITNYSERTGVVV